MVFGFAVKSLFNIYSTMIFLLLGICILMLGQGIYRSGEAYVDASFYERNSLGNLGFNGQRCRTSSLRTNSMSFSCSSGVIKLLDSVALIPQSASAEEKQQCSYSSITESCNHAFNGIQFRIKFYDVCLDKSRCQLEDLRKFVTSNVGDCPKQDSVIFAQFQCEEDDENLAKKRVRGLWITTITIFICLVFLSVVSFLKRIINIQYTEWDQNTITIKDYSVLLELKYGTYDQFKRARRI